MNRVHIRHLDVPTVLRRALMLDQPPLGWFERWAVLLISLKARVAVGDIYWR